MTNTGDVFLCDAVRTPIGRYGGALARVRTDDLAAIPIRALMGRNPKVDWAALDEVVFGCANQAGEDNRNVARMALLLAGIPDSVPGVTVNRLCASGLNAIGDAARAIRCGETEFAIAGGVESMTRAPLVMAKAQEAFQRSADIYDTTLGWRFINPLLKAQYGVDSMAETGENVAEEYQVSRADQDAFAVRSQQRAGKAMASGYFAEEIVAVEVPGGTGGPGKVGRDVVMRARKICRGRSSRRQERAGEGGEGRASAPGNDARRLEQAQADRAQSRHHHGGQRLGHQRRRRGRDPRLGGSGAAPRAYAARAR